MEEKRFLEEDFGDFLSELVDGQRLNESKEYGIAKLAIEKGYSELTDKQKFVLKNAIEDFVYDDCLRCSCPIPWSEMYATEEYGQYCSWCKHMMDKED